MKDVRWKAMFVARSHSSTLSSPIISAANSALPNSAANLDYECSDLTWCHKLLPDKQADQSNTKPQKCKNNQGHNKNEIRVAHHTGTWRIYNDYSNNKCRVQMIERSMHHTTVSCNW